MKFDIDETGRGPQREKPAVGTGSAETTVQPPAETPARSPSTAGQSADWDGRPHAQDAQLHLWVAG